MTSLTETNEPKYREITIDLLTLAKEEIKKPLKTALEQKIISDTEFEAMDPSDKKAGKFYQLL